MEKPFKKIVFGLQGYKYIQNIYTSNCLANHFFQLHQVGVNSDSVNSLSVGAFLGMALAAAKRRHLAMSTGGVACLACGFLQLTLENRPNPKMKGSSSNHPFFAGDMLVFGRVYIYIHIHTRIYIYKYIFPGSQPPF